MNVSEIGLFDRSLDSEHNDVPVVEIANLSVMQYNSFSEAVPSDRV